MKTSDKESHLLEIQNAQARFALRKINEGMDQIIIALPHRCGIKGYIYQYKGHQEAYLEQISVRSDLQGKGIGKRLLQIFAATAKDLGARTIYDEVVTPAMLKISAHVFGGNNLLMMEIPKNYPNGRSRRIHLPLDVLIADFQPIRVFSDLSNVNDQAWERPIRKLKN